MRCRVLLSVLVSWSLFLSAVGSAGATQGSDVPGEGPWICPGASGVETSIAGMLTEVASGFAGGGDPTPAVWGRALIPPGYRVYLSGKLELRAAASPAGGRGVIWRLVGRDHLGVILKDSGVAFMAHRPPGEATVVEVPRTLVGENKSATVSRFPRIPVFVSTSTLREFELEFAFRLEIVPGPNAAQSVQRCPDPGTWGGFYDESRPQWLAHVGDPVDPVSGNAVLQRTDVEAPVHGWGADWRRVHNSLDVADGVLGRGWSTLLDVNLRTDPATDAVGGGSVPPDRASVELRFEDGRRARFVNLAPGRWLSPEGVDGRLVLDQVSGLFALHFDNGVTWSFDSQGRLTSRSRWTGESVAIRWSDVDPSLPAGVVARVSGSGGWGWDAFDDDGDLRLDRVVTTDGRVVSYHFGLEDVTDRSGSVLRALDEVVDPAGDAESIVSEYGRIVEVRDPKGRPLVRFAYDSTGRALDQVTDSGDEVDFLYDQVDPHNGVLGATRVRFSAPDEMTGIPEELWYLFDESARVLGVVDSAGKPVVRSFDEGRLSSVSDRRGAQWREVHDRHGRLVQRVLPDALTGAVPTMQDPCTGLFARAGAGDGYATEEFTYVSQQPECSRFLDDFAGVDSGVALGAHGPRIDVSGTGWQEASGSWSVDSGSMVAGDARALALFDAGVPDGELRLRRSGAATGLVVRAVDSQNYLVVRSSSDNGGTLALDRVVDATPSVVAEKRFGGLTGSGRVRVVLDGDLVTVVDERSGEALHVTLSGDDLAMYGAATKMGVVSIEPGAAFSAVAFDQLATAGSVADHRLASIRDVGANTTSFEYSDPSDPDDRIASRVIEGDTGAATSISSADGLVRSVSDPDGVVTALEYGSECGAAPRLLCRVTVAPGTSQESSTRFVYDAGGRLVEEIAGDRSVDPLSTHYAYDAVGRLVSVSDPAVGVLVGHHRHEYRYDSSGRVVCESDSANPVSAEDCDEDSATWFYRYDDRGNLISRTDAAGAQTSFEHDSAGRVIVERGPGTSAGGPRPETHFVYDVMGRLAERTGPDAVREVYGYDFEGNQIRREQHPADGGSPRVWTSEYDLRGRLVRSSDPEQVVSTWAYDQFGRVVESRRAVGTADEVVKRNTYDAAGRLVGVELPDGSRSATVYTPAGRVAEKRTPPPNDPDYVWTDGDSAHSVTGFAYDAAGRTARIVDAEEAVRDFTYDAHGRVTSVSGPPPGVLPVDIDGQPTTWSAIWDTYNPDPAAGLWAKYRTDFAYDVLGRVTSVVTPDPHAPGSVVRREQLWDARGNVIQATDSFTPGTPRLGVRGFTFDERGLLESATDPLGTLTTYEHDLAGRRTSRISAHPDESLGEIVDRWSYDIAGRQTGTWRESSTTGATRYRELLYDYDGFGQLSSIVDAAGRSETRSYDRRGLLSSQIFTDGSDTTELVHTLDSLGRVTTLTDSSQTQSWAYDQMGRVAEAKFTNGETVNYRYDQVGNRISYLIEGALEVQPGSAGTQEGDASFAEILEVAPESPEGFRLPLFYDRLGRLASIGDPGAAHLGYSWDGAGRLVGESSSQLPENTLEGRRTYSYGPSGALKSYEEFLSNRGQTELDTHWDLEWNSSGRLVGIAEAGEQAESFGYDQAGQLTEWNQGNGNRREWKWESGYRTRVLDGNAGSSHWQYDESGQLVDVATSANAHTRFTWDRSGRLSTVESKDGSEIANTWDERAMLTSREYGSGVSEQRAWAPNGQLDSVTRTTPSGSTATKVFWDQAPPTGVAQPMKLSIDGQDTVIVHAPAWEPLQGAAAAFPVTDGLGFFSRHPLGHLIDSIDVDFFGLTSPVPSDALIASASYDPWGNASTHNPHEPFPSEEGTGTPISFGYRSELHLGDQIHLRGRDYQPATATFTSPDPLDGVDGTPVVANPYHYADNDPLNKTDPLGLRPGDTEYAWAAVLPLYPVRPVPYGPWLIGALGAYGVYLAGSWLYDTYFQATPNTPIATSPHDEAGTQESTQTATKPSVSSTTFPPPPPPPPPPRDCDAPQTGADDPCEGMLVYRVYGPGAGAGEFGASWSPVDPRSVGRERYRDLAGLPDSNPGTHLVIGELIDPIAARIRPGGALPCGPPHCAEERPGGLPEYIIENNPVAVVNRTYVTLSPPY